MRPDHSSWNLRPLNRRVLIALALLLPVCAAAVTPSDYAYRFALQTKGNSEAWRVELTPAVYAVSRRDADLHDLVVVNAQGREVPFASLPVTAPMAHPYALKAHLLPLPADAAHPDDVRVQRNANGDIVIDQSRGNVAEKPTQWLVDAKREVSLESIEFDASALTQDLRIHLAVDSSNDLQQWENRSDDTEIVSIKRGDDAVEQNKISISGEPARYYRLRLIDGNAPWDSTQTPLVNLAGSFIDAAADGAASRQWQTLKAQATSKSASGGTDYDYQLPATLPVEAARVILAGANTVARFVLTTHDAEGAADASLATITAVQAGHSANDARVDTFDAIRVQHLRLHTDTPLAQAPALAVGWHPDTLVFLAEGAGPYSLLVGSYAARRGDYPVDAALEKMRPADAGGDWQPPQAMLGERSDAGGAAALLAPKVPYDWTKPLLWIVLVGGALLVAGMALSLLRQSKRDDDNAAG
ncbi:DUF3999 family protein [Rhodanobacter sp. L36]|uniref:DUF3999 family protein n=1 Tax=Rhodanobacter sp. L36 TaxID=1747221 RepID=UPI00131D8B8F|nr:DUF3999 family protein [Rhodanobacter sp. L36]